MSAHPNELDWTKLLTGELGWVAGWRLTRHIAGCEPCREKHVRLEKERQNFQASPGRREDLAVLLRKAESSVLRGRGPDQRIWWVFPVAVTAIAVAVLQATPSSTTFISKGSDAFTVYVVQPTGAKLLGGRCSEGDLMTATYRTDRAYLLVVERDERGTTQVLFPPSGTRSAKIDAPHGTLPQSWVLDSQQGRECFGAFFSDEPLEAAIAGEILGEAGAPRERPHVRVVIHCCSKEAP